MRIVVLGLVFLVVSATSRAETSEQEKKHAWCMFQADRMCRAEQISKPNSARDDQEQGPFCTAKAEEWCKTHG